MLQIVESSFLQKLHDLYSCEVEASDGLHLVPFGSERILGINPKQYAMQCSAMSKELKLVWEHNLQDSFCNEYLSDLFVQ